MIRKENQSFGVFHVLIFRLNLVVLCIQYAIPMALLSTCMTQFCGVQFVENEIYGGLICVILGVLTTYE